MADVTLTIVIPSAKVSLVKGVADLLAQRERLIEPTESLTNAQAKAYLEQHCRQFLVQLVGSVNGAEAGNSARETASAEARSIFD